MNKHKLFISRLEKIYGEFDKTSYKVYGLKKLPNESLFYHGEIIKWAKDVKPSKVLLVGESNDIKVYFQKEFQIKGIYTAGLTNSDYYWDFDKDFPGCDKFDLVISQAVIEHLINPYKHLSDLVKRLYQGGFLILHSVSCGFRYHRFPIDACRFFPDWFEEIAKPDRLDLKIIKKRFRVPHIFYMYLNEKER